MNKIRNLFFVVVIALFAHSCADPDDPTMIQIAQGEWIVENVIANGQLNEIFEVNSVLHLDRNDSFLFVNVDGRATAGTWTATETTLTLNGSDGSTQSFTIVNLTWEKMHVYRTFNNPVAGQIELRYLFRRN